MDQSEKAKFFIRELVERSRKAQLEFRQYSQERVDEVVTAAAWAVMQPARAEHLARLEVAESGMGNVADKTHKNQFRVFGTLAQMKGKRSVGVIEEDPQLGITKIAKPKGVFCALTPSTNMATGTTQNILAVLKGRNSVIVSPQPRTRGTAKETCDFIRDAIAKVDGPRDIVLCVEDPTRERRDQLMAQSDVVLATGGAALVKAAYRSGRPAIGVGPGNSVTVVDGTGDLEEAARLIARGKTFDYATSCSSENAVVIQRDSFARVMKAFEANGGYLVSKQEKAQLQAVMWRDGKLNDQIICRPPRRIAELAGFEAPSAHEAKFFIIEEEGAGPDYPFSGEKLSVVLTAYRYEHFEEAIGLVSAVVGYQGRGHSCGIHSADPEHIAALAERIDVCRVLVNQVQSSGNSGNFNNGLPFTATLGCGSWGGNSIDGNVTWEHCINITRLSVPIPDRTPEIDDVFREYFAKYGR